jgi:hypothetical protein
MIGPEKLPSALYALHTILVLARQMAYDRNPHEEIAGVLDAAEYLPQLLAGGQDETHEFREHLKELSSKYPRFDLALQRFEGSVPARW